MAQELLAEFYGGLASEADLKNLVTTKTKENIHLEFKTKKDRSTPTLDPSDAWQFSRALSGFGNSDGGVLVWGIETDARDQARKLKPISGANEFLGVLKKSLLNSTQPVVDGVVMDVIFTATSPSRGYVKCLIPASEKTPHRAMLADREYYRRTTEGFYRLEHFDLEDMFGRRPHPLLNLILELRPRPGDDPHSEFQFAITNLGRGIGKYPGFFCRFGDNVKVVGASGYVVNVSAANNGLPTVTYHEHVGVVHPTGIPTIVGHAILLQQVKGAPVKVSLSWYCENMSMKHYEGDVSV